MGKIFSIDDVVADGSTIKLSNEVTWNFEESPHLLVSGSSTLRKRDLLLSMMKAIPDIGEGMLISPNGLSEFGRKNGKKICRSELRYFTSNDVTARLEIVMSLIEERLAVVREETLLNNKGYTAHGFDPYFLILDDFHILKSLYSEFYDEEVKFDELISKIVWNGEDVGLFVILSTVFPKATLVSSLVRNLFKASITLGNLSELGFRIAFNNFGTLEYSNKPSGTDFYWDSGSDRLINFSSPYIPEKSVLKDYFDIYVEDMI